MKNDLMLNNYPANFITKYFEDHKKRIQYQSVSMKEPIDFNKIFVLPHIKFYTKELRQILQEKYGFKVVYNYPFMLEKIVKKAKDQTENMQQKYVVYKIDCKNCSKTYVGQTKRLLETRVCVHQTKSKPKSEMF